MLLAALGLAACARPATVPPVETAPRVAAPRPTPEPTPETTPETAPGPAEIPLCADRATCLPPHRDALVAALREAESDPLEAHERLASLPLPVAFAWRAYLHHVGNRLDESSRVLGLLGPSADPPATPAGADPGLLRVLFALRTHTEALLDGAHPDDDAPLVPCWLFVRHPREALVAFGPRPGAPGDAALAVHTRRCADTVARP